MTGTTYEETLGMLTAITEQTRNASKASRGLVQISSRLTQVLDDSSKTGAKLKDIYSGLGIELMDSNGQIRSTYDILEDLSKQWDGLTKNEKEYIALTSAGSNQVQNFMALMNGFSQAIDATTTAYESSGSAAKENEKAMDTIGKKAELLRSQFEQLILGEGGLQSFAKGLLDVGIAILKFANSDVGQTIIKVTALVATMALLIKAFVALKATMSTGAGIGIFLSAIQSLIVGEATLTAVTETLTTALLANPLFWGVAAVAGITLIVTAIDALNVTLEEQIEKLNEAKSAYEDAQNSVDGLESQLEAINSKIKEINSQDGAKVAREGELNELNRQKAELESMLEIEKERLRLAQLQYEQEAKKTVYKTQAVAEANENRTDVVFVDKDRVQILKDNAQAMLEYQQVINDSNVVIEELNDKLSRNGELSEQEQQQLEEAKSKRDSALNSYNELSAESTEYATQLEDEISLLSEDSEVRQYAMEGINAHAEALKATTEAQEESAEVNENLNEILSELTDEQKDSIDSLLEKHEELSEHLQEIAEYMEETGCSAEEAAEQLGYITDNASEAVSATEQLSEATSDLNNALDALNGMSSAYDTLSNAMDEYNSTGQFSLSTLTDLIALGTDYMNLLEIENGQMTINEQGLKNLANTYIDDAEAKAYDKAMAELEAAAQEESNKAHQAGQSAGSASYSGSITAANGAKQAAQAALEGANAFNQFWTAATKGQYQGKVSTATINSIGNSLSTTLKTLESFRTSVNNNTTATIKSTGATKASKKATGGSTKATKANTSAVDANTKALKANVDALKKQKEALEDEVKNYETVIDYLNDKVDEEIDKLEELRDAEVQVLEDRIDYYEELADAEDEELKNRIDNLEEARDAEEEYWNAKIDAIKAANDATEDQIELETLLQNLALAKSKKVKVYRQGQGFVYETDQEAVSEAESELNEYYRKRALEDQIASLEKQRDDALNIYNQQIKDLENYRTQVNQKYEDIVSDLKKQVEAIKEKYNDQIQILKDWQDAFEKQTSAYEEEIKRQLTIQMTGIDTEQANWTTRLNNLSAFVSAYNAKLKELDDITAALERAEAAYNSAQSSISSGSSYDSGGGSYSVSGGGSTTPTVQTANYKVLGYEKKFSSSSSAQSYIMGKPASERGKYAWVEHNGAYYVCLRSKIKTYSGITETKASKYAEQYKPLAIYWKYATGVSSVGSDRAALVGDNPKYRELVIGSKLNNDQGTIMSLKRGTGVVNAKSTNTLAGILNSLSGQTSNAKQVSNNSNNGTTITIGSISLPEVKDGKSFVDYLQNFSADITQLSYART